MALTYGSLVDIQRMYFYDASADTYTLRGSVNNTVNADFFPDDAAVGDCMMFGSQGNAHRQFFSLNINVGTALAASSIDGVWEYARRDGGDYTNPTWHALENVEDETNMFQVTGTKGVHFKIPTDWENYIYPNGTTIYYAYWVRFRITSITGITEGGAVGTTNIDVRENTLIIDSAYTLGSLYTASETLVTPLYSWAGSSAADASPHYLKQQMRAGTKYTLGGSDSANLYIYGFYFTVTDFTVRITGLDIDGNIISEDILVTSTAYQYLTKVYRDITTVQIISVTGAGIIFAGLYQKGLGVVFKTGDNQFTIDCNLKSTDTGSITDSYKQIQFTKNNCFALFNGGLYFGSSTGGRGYAGVDILHESENTSFASIGAFGGAAQNNIYNASSLRVIPSGQARHGYWSSFGVNNGDTVNDCLQEGNRQLSLGRKENTILNLRAYGQHTEPALSILDGLTSYGGSFAMRPSNAENKHFIYNADFSGTTSYTIQPWNVSSDPYEFRLVDCKWSDAPLEQWQVAWRHANTTSYTDQNVIEAVSALLVVVDEKGNPVNNAKVVIENALGEEVLNCLTNEDGFANLDKGTATAGSTVALLEDTSKAWNVDTDYAKDDEWWLREIYITSGTGEGQRRICAYNHSITTQIPHYDFVTAPDATSKYIIIPYLDIKKFSPSVFTTGYSPSTVTDLNPFTIKVSASGYKSESNTVRIDKKLSSTIVLNSKRYPNR